MTGQIHRLLAGAALVLCAGAAAYAQTPPAGPPGPGKGIMMRAPQTAAEHAARLRDLLQLKPAQEPALQAFASALESARQSLRSGMTAGPPPQTTPERLARMQQMMTLRQSAMTAVIEATRRFYDQLDPAQKRAFDALPTQRGMGMGGMHGMGGMGGMEGMPMGPPPPGSPPPSDR
jgi:hypothetical protein